MNNKQLPPLPDPNIGLPWRHNAPDGSIHSSAFTAEQMREYALQAIVHATQPAEVTDDEQQAIDQIMEQAQVFASAWSLVGGRFDSGYALDDALEAKEELREMVARAILALRPVQVPMTDEERKLAAIDWSPCVRAAFNAGVNAAERHHGITAQAKKEAP